MKENLIATLYNDGVNDSTMYDFTAYIPTEILFKSWELIGETRHGDKIYMTQINENPSREQLIYIELY